MSGDDAADDRVLRWLAIVVGLALLVSLVIPFAVTARNDGWSDATAWMVSGSGLLAGLIGCSLFGVVGWMLGRRRRKQHDGD